MAAVVVGVDAVCALGARLAQPSTNEHADIKLQAAG